MRFLRMATEEARQVGKKTLLIFTIFIELGATIPRGSGS